MAKISDEAKEYEPQQTKNIADLEIVPTDAEVHEETFKEGTDDEFKLKVIHKDNESYRVPISVLKSLKVLLEEQPELKFFKVKKTGEGLKTEYTVIPVN